MRRTLLLATALAATFATGHPLAARASEPVTIEDDQFDRRATFTSEQVDFDDPEYSEFSSTMRLRSWVDKATGKVTHQLYVSNYYDIAWRYYAAATDETATSLEFVTIDRTVVGCFRQGCVFHKTYAAMLDDRVLRAHAENGTSYWVKFHAKDGPDQILELSTAVIRQQLTAVDNYTAKLIPASPTTKKATRPTSKKPRNTLSTGKP